MPFLQQCSELVQVIGTGGNVTIHATGGCGSTSGVRDQERCFVTIDLGFYSGGPTSEGLALLDPIALLELVLPAGLPDNIADLDRLEVHFVPLDHECT